MNGFDSNSPRASFLLPFSHHLWFSLFGSACVLALFLFFVSRLSPFGAHGKYLQSEEAELAMVHLETRRKSTLIASNAQVS